MFNVAVCGPVTPAAVPEKSTLAEPSCAVDPTVTVTLCGAPGVSVNVAGVTLTPGDGRVVTLIGALKPLIAVAETSTVALPVCAIVIAGGATFNVKSGGAVMVMPID